MHEDIATIRVPAMVLVKIDGGLGSQMWQYALGRGAGVYSGLRVGHDISWYRHSGKDTTGLHNRHFILNTVFRDARLQLVSENTRALFAAHLDYYSGRRHAFEEELFTSPHPRYLGGYYMNARYIDMQGDALRELYTFHLSLSAVNQEVLARIHTTEAPVAIHIRRGDYVGSTHDTTTPQYFRQAVDTICADIASQKQVFFVFSNGMDWAKDVLGDLPHEFVFVENNENDDGQYDMFLMSQCKHFIISNSSMSWWAAWLSTRGAQKTVVMPDMWFTDESPDERLSLHVPGWKLVAVA